jgi:hypothetical protein
MPRKAWEARSDLQNPSRKTPGTNRAEAACFPEEGPFQKMQESLEAMKVAVRVLGTLNQNQSPDGDDLDRLRQLAPLSAHLPADELACEVIQQAIKHRAEVRAKVRGANGSG